MFQISDKITTQKGKICYFVDVFSYIFSSCDQPGYLGADVVDIKYKKI